jgi:hypothetical protein
LSKPKSRATIAKELSKQIATEPSDIAKQIVSSYKERREAIKAGIEANDVGTANYLAYQVQLVKLDRSERDELASRGLVPENLGVAVQPNFVFTAKISMDGVTTTKGSDEDEAIRERLDKEYDTQC